MDLLSRTLPLARALVIALAIPACSLGLDRSLADRGAGGEHASVADETTPTPKPSAPLTTPTPTPTPDAGAAPPPVQEDNPIPTILSIAPLSATVGAASANVTLTGTGFVAASKIVFAGNELATSRGSAGELTATVPAALLAKAGSFDITVTSPAPGGGESRPRAFTVANPAGVAITSVTPSRVLVDSPGLDIAVVGTGFVAGSVVSLNGAPLATTYASATRVTAQVRATALTAAGNFPVTVTNPAPGGGVSVPLAFTVENPVPTVASISPSSIVAGSPSTVVTVTGAAFRTGATITFNGTPLATQQTSATVLKTTVPASFLAAAGRFDIAVTNTGPGGGRSAALTLDVPAQNFVLNPSFELGDTSWEHWFDDTLSPDPHYIDSSGGHSGAKRLIISLDGAFQHYASQLVRNLANGTYDLTGWFQSSGGQTNVSFGVQGYGGPLTEIDLPLSPITTWTKFTVPGITVTKGECEVYVWADMPPGPHSLLVDDIALLRP